MKQYRHTSLTSETRPAAVWLALMLAACSAGSPATTGTGGGNGSGTGGRGGAGGPNIDRTGGAGGAASSGGSGGSGAPGSGGSGSSTGGATGSGGSGAGNPGGGGTGAGGSGPGGSGGPATDARPAEAGNPNGNPLPPNPPETGVIPVLWITVGRAIPRDSKVDGRMKVIEDHDGTLMGIQSRPAKHDVRIGIEIRGQSSFNYDQKPYGFEIRDEMGNGLAIPLLGMPQEPDFILHSCYADKTCMRNALTYALGRELGEAKNRWTPRTRWVEVYVDGQYKGLYLLVERIKRDRARVQMPPPAADMNMGDITGGYIVSQEGDGVRPGEDWSDPFAPRHRFVYRFPKHDVVTPAQKTYVQQSLLALFRAIEQDPHFSPAILQRIDADSWIDYMLLQELTNNVDIYWKSWFLHKQPDGRARRQVVDGPAVGLRHRLRQRHLQEALLRQHLGPHRDPRAHDRPVARQGPAGHAPLPLEHPARRRRPAGHRPHRGEARRLGQTHRHRQDPRQQPVEQRRPVGLAQQLHRPSWANEVTYLRYWLRKRLAWLDANLSGSCPSVPAPPAVSPIASPPYVPPRNAREPYIGRDAPDYVPIEGNVGGQLATWACPR